MEIRVSINYEQVVIFGILLRLRLVGISRCRTIAVQHVGAELGSTQVGPWQKLSWHGSTRK